MLVSIAVQYLQTRLGSHRSRHTNLRKHFQETTQKVNPRTTLTNFARTVIFTRNQYGIVHIVI